MLRKLVVLAIAALCSGTSMVPAHAGGRARVEIVRAPAAVPVGAAFEIAFRVQPELGMRRNVEPMVRASREGHVLTFAPAATRERGRYVARLTLPEAGDWSIQVDSRYCETRMSPLLVKVVEAKSKTS